MKGQDDRLRAELDAREADFRRELVERLRAAAAGGDTLLFLVSILRPSVWTGLQTWKGSDELYARAESILELRARLDRVDDNCPAARFIAACREHVDLANGQRLGPRRAAQRLLAQLESDPR